MAMAPGQALALLLVLVPLVATASFAAKPADGVFEWDSHSSEPSHDLLKWSPYYDADRIDGIVSHVPLSFIGPDMSVCHASTCDTSEIRRELALRRRYLSYDILKKYHVPCNRRGHSYYNCQRGRQANPYRRGCSIITQCGRILN